MATGFDVSFEFVTDVPETELPYEPHVSFRETAWRKLSLYTQRCPLEIGGLGVVSQSGQDFVVEDVFVLRQDVNDIATRLEPDSVHELLFSTVTSGGDPSELRLWWHSHAREAVFWSGEDEATIERFRNDGMLSLVTNHEGRILGRLDRYRPRTTAWLWVDVPPGDLEPPAEELEEIDREVETKTRHVPRSTSRVF